MSRIALKRAYEPPAPGDGTRVLVERLWPRGVRKEEAAIDLWPKEVAPSPELRKWYGHDRGRWEEFRRRYRAELEVRPEAREAVRRLRDLAREGRVTFVLATKDVEHSSAALLREHLEAASEGPGPDRNEEGEADS